ncbi:MAG: PACE efflux transporter [Halopseudomonas sp.]
MRTPLDRLRHTLLFELFAILIAAPAAHWLTGKPMSTVGSLTVILSLLAMAWNYLYNWGFDHWEHRQNWPLPRKLATRILHAIGFEAALLLVGIFIIAYWLQLSLWQAFILDVGFMGFFLFYALAYNWAYDRIFPLPLVQAID